MLFAAALGLAFLATACLGSGSTRGPGTGTGDSRVLGMVDAKTGSGDSQIVPRYDSGVVPGSDQGTKPTPDTYSPPKPDVTPAGPTGPFGNSVGMTATNITGLQDCDGKKMDLHSYYNTGKGVVFLLNKAS